MIFTCNYCPAVLPNFKELVEHCQREHPDKLRRYEIKNLKLKQTVLQYADSAERLIELHKWRIKDCTIKEIE